MKDNNRQRSGQNNTKTQNHKENIQKMQMQKKARAGYERNLIAMLLFFPLAVFYMEIIVRLCTIGNITLHQLINVFLFSFCTGAVISVVITLIRNRWVVRITSILLTIVLALVLGSQMIYFKIFSTYYSLDSLGMAGEAMTDFSTVMFATIWENILFILILCLPVVVILLFNKRMTYYPMKKLPPIITYFCISIVALSFIFGTVSVSFDRSELGAMHYYRYPDAIDTAKHVGILTSTRLNLHKIIFGGHKEKVEIQSGMNDITNPFAPNTPEGTTAPPNTDPPTTTVPGQSTTEKPPEPPKDYGYNILDNITLNNNGGQVVSELNKYFSALNPTKKNEYTGMFEGYNLIFLTLEGFSGKVIDRNLTPTLYMMANNGFVFENFYNGTWGGSTSTGEYANLTGNFYNSTKCMTDYIGKTYQPFALGNQFKELGYTVKGYHAWTYTYYNRDQSHPALGYTDWIGYNRNNVSGYNGLENYKDANGNGMTFPWVPSDYDTARITVNDFIDKEPFHVYYMTISGHTNYNWSGNAMCKKHRAEINAYCQQYGLYFSEEVKAYLACQLEVELMVRELVERLDDAGKLDTTVFVMGTDHYPYGLSDESLAELYDLPQEGIHGNFELYKNTLIIWNSAMEEPIYIDTPCSAIDILPTVSNLFGLPFDSRLLAGTDVLSGTEPVVIVNFDKGAGSWNWLTRYGTYKTVGKKFTVADGFTASDGEISAYVSSINSLVRAKRINTFYVLEYDYYSFVFGKK